MHPGARGPHVAQQSPRGALEGKAQRGPVRILSIGVVEGEYGPVAAEIGDRADTAIPQPDFQGVDQAYASSSSV
jgi:hypothetical protein